jgi:hypothetical protein
MGIRKDLKLVGNDFSNAATWFFIAYLIAEAPLGTFHASDDVCILLISATFSSNSSAKDSSSQMARSKCLSLGGCCGGRCGHP